MKITPRDEIIIGVVVIVLLVVGLAMVLVRPQMGKLGEMAAKQAEQEDAIRNAEGDLEVLKGAKSEALQIQADMIKVANQVPDSPELPSLVVEIQDLANEAGISFVSIEPKDMVASGQYTTLPIDLDLSGGFFDVVDFLYRLQHLTREVRVTDLELTAKMETQGGTQGETGGQTQTGSQSTASGELEVAVTANVFVMGTAPGATSPTQSSGGGGQAAPTGGQAAPTGGGAAQTGEGK